MVPRLHNTCVMLPQVLYVVTYQQHKTPVMQPVNPIWVPGNITRHLPGTTAQTVEFLITIMKIIVFLGLIDRLSFHFYLYYTVVRRGNLSVKNS
jgi:hypothetical protein